MSESKPGITDIFEARWPNGLKQNVVYKIDCDDKGRNGGNFLTVLVVQNGDVHVSMQDWEDFPDGAPTPFPSIRIRTIFGGGRYDRVRQALLNLAEAIMLDTETGKANDQN